jgi:hypothetical protein
MHEPSETAQKNVTSLIYACSITLHLQHKHYTTKSDGPCSLASSMKHTVELFSVILPVAVATSF